MKIKTLLFSVLIFTLAPFVVAANIVITEVMYDNPGADTDHEWIEVQNTGASAIDLSTYKFFEANTNHSIIFVQGSQTLAPQDFAIIADKPSTFLSDNSSFANSLFDSSFSLSNSGEALVIKDPNGDAVDTVNYDTNLGGAGDGNSLQKLSSGWKAQSPTPGLPNADAGGPSQTSSTTNQNTTIQSSSVSAGGQTYVVSTHYVYRDISLLNDEETKDDFSVSAGRNRLTSAGSPIQFHANVKGGISKNRLAYKWSLGDGMIAYGETVEHVYSFPGDYVAVLNVSGDGNEAVHRINVRVIEPALSVRRVPGGIEIKNKGKDEINLYKWLLTAGHSSYTIPADLIIAAGKSVTFGANATRLPEGGDISLVDTEGRSARLLAWDAARTTVQTGTAVKTVPSPNTIKPETQTASVNNVLVIEHQSGFFSKIGNFFKHLFSPPR